MCSGEGGGGPAANQMLKIVGMTTSSALGLYRRKAKRKVASLRMVSAEGTT